jgi:phage baseplate assembly protein W
MAGGRELLGGGLSFPLRVGDDGRLAVSEGAVNVREHLEVVLRTRPGERVRLNAFGAGLDELRSEPNTPATHREVEDRIRRALTAWEPRIALEGVEVGPDAADPESAVATVHYRLRATGAATRLAVAVALEG